MCKLLNEENNVDINIYEIFSLLLIFTNQFRVKFSVLVCAAAADDPSDGAPDPRGAHPGRLHHPRRGC